MDLLKNALKFGQDNDEPKSENAIDLLKQDHHKVKKIFSDLENAGSNEKPILIKQLISELEIHTKLEEKFIYPLLESRTPEAIDEAHEEHHVVQLLLDELKSKTPSRVDAKITVLKEMVLHHIREEENDILPRLEVGDDDLDEVGAQMKAQKELLIRESEKPETSTAPKKAVKKAPAIKKGTTTRGSTRKPTASSRKTATTRKATASVRKPASVRKAKASVPSGRSKTNAKPTSKSPTAAKKATKTSKTTTKRAAKTTARKTSNGTRGRAKASSRRTSSK